MKSLTKALFAIAVLGFGVFSCQKTMDQAIDRDDVNARVVVDVPTECAGPYTVTLEQKTMVNGNWQWTWKVVNPNPGNGENGTVQELSHMNFAIPLCVPGIEVVGASWSVDGISWTNVASTTPVVDPSIVNTCDPNHDVPTIKFGLDQNGYIRLVITNNVHPGLMTGYYKSGGTTGCGSFCFEGIGCDLVVVNPNVGCSFSQGFWFAKPLSEDNAWPGGGVTMGGETYTAEEARSLWGVSGNIELKRAFTQAATIKLSMDAGFLLDPTEVIGYVNSIDAVLANLPKLTPGNLVSTNRSLSSATRKNLGNWAGAIGSFVDENHCEINPGF
jgi:hypothetical protein